MRRGKSAMRWVGLALVSAVMFSMLAIPVFSQPEPPAFIDDHFEAPQRPPARFDHDAHADDPSVKGCWTCHHLYEDGKLVPEESSEDQRCAECHPLEASGSQTRLVAAYHMLCQTCHDKAGKGPLTCGECHQRQDP